MFTKKYAQDCSKHTIPYSSKLEITQMSFEHRWINTLQRVYEMAWHIGMKMNNYCYTNGMNESHKHNVELKITEKSV